MDPIWKSDFARNHTTLLLSSYRQLTGRELLPVCSLEVPAARALFEAPFVVVSHGTEPDPVLNYGNATSLELWGMSWSELTRTPSRCTAEAPEREERSRLLDSVARNGFIDDYSGIRVTKDGRRFRIEAATVWNLKNAEGQLVGQAATFAQWHWL